MSAEHKPHLQLRKTIVEGLMHERPSFMAGLEALDSLVEQNEFHKGEVTMLSEKLDGLLEQLGAAQREIKQLRRALDAEVTARLLPPDVTERSHEGSNPAKRPT